MSWSVSAFGKARAVEDAIAKQFAATAACAEPEESVRQAARQIISIALEGMRQPNPFVRVNASGSMWHGVGTNSLTIKIEPESGFVE